jgi:hypothetical protein
MWMTPLGGGTVLYLSDLLVDELMFHRLLSSI